MYLKGMGLETARQREMELSSAGPRPKGLQLPALDQSQEPGTPSDTPRWVAAARPLSLLC